jgi:hypothetical protein
MAPDDRSHAAAAGPSLHQPKGGAEWVIGNYLWKDFAKQTDTYFAQGLYATGIAACRLAV